MSNHRSAYCFTIEHQFHIFTPKNQPMVTLKITFKEILPIPKAVILINDTCTKLSHTIHRASMLF